MLICIMTHIIGWWNSILDNNENIKSYLSACKYNDNISSKHLKIHLTIIKVRWGPVEIDVKDIYSLSRN